jgi:hypothetical protein
MDQEILATKKAKAQENAKTEISAVFDGNGEAQLSQSSVSKTMLQSYASVVDMFNRIESSPGTFNQSYAISGSLGSQKDLYTLKKHSSDDPPKREESVDERRSLHSDSSSSLQGENSLRSRVLYMDRNTLNKLE